MQVTATHITQQVVAMVRYVNKYYSFKLSPFLNPYELAIAQNVIAQQPEAFGLNVSHFGGYLHAERQRLLLAPDYLVTDYQDFDLQLFEIIFNQKFVRLQHYQILGKLAHLGLDRNLFGDIITDGQRWQFIAEYQFQDLIRQEVTQIGNSKVTIKLQPLDQLLTIKNDFTNETIACSSLRLDAVIAAAFHQSRKNAKDLINSGHVFLNWEHERRSDYLLTVGDSVSCRGWGRLTILDFLGQTPTNKYKLYLKIFRH